MYFWPLLALLAGLFGALLVGWLVVGCGARAALTIEHLPSLCKKDDYLCSSAGG